MWTTLAIISGAAAGMCLLVLGAPEWTACVAVGAVVGAVLVGR